MNVEIYVKLGNVFLKTPDNEEKVLKIQRELEKLEKKYEGFLKVLFAWYTRKQK